MRHFGPSRSHKKSFHYSHMHRGHSFLSANEELLARYAACPTSAEVIAVQAAYLAELQAPPRPSPGAPEIRGLGSGEIPTTLVTPELWYALRQPECAKHGRATMACQACLSRDPSTFMHACCPSASPQTQRAGAGRGDDYMSAMDLPPSESESGSDAEAPGTSHNPNRPSRRAALGPAWAWHRWTVMCSQMVICLWSLHMSQLSSGTRPSGGHQGLMSAMQKLKWSAVGHMLAVGTLLPCKVDERQCQH